MMVDTLFDTPKKKEEAIIYFQGLLNDPGWKLLVRVMEENIKLLESQLRNGVGIGETIHDIDMIRRDIKCYENVKDTPTKLIHDFEEATTPETDTKIDPFETLEDMEKPL